MKKSLARRRFLKGTAAGAVAAGAAAVVPLPAKAQTPQPSAAPAPLSKAAETQTPPAARSPHHRPPRRRLHGRRPQVARHRILCANPGSSFRGLHESLINYGGNKDPEFLTCCHEESSVAMAHGYAKIEGKPLMVDGARHRRPAARVDGDLQRLRATACPSTSLLGNIARRRRTAAATSTGRTACRTPPPWCATTSSGTTRPSRCTHFAESAVRAYKIAMTPPYEPVRDRGRRRCCRKSPCPKRDEATARSRSCR